MYRVGVIGAGQLARMMQPAAIALGIELRVFAEAEGASASQSATRVGDYTNFDALREFAEGVDVITFDHEHVPIELLEKLETLGHRVNPGPAALVHAQNKLTMRRKLAELGLPQPVWAAVKTLAEVESFIAHNGPKIVAKTPIGGYDGKGVMVVESAAQLAHWVDAIAEFGGELLLEEKVDFTRELAQLCARNEAGELAFWPVVETRQRLGVCSEVIAPAANANQGAIAKISGAIAEGLSVTGVMAVELFETSTGVLVNELAMRPHNSGHFSIEGAVTSQFEQHLRAVLNLPLGDTGLLATVAVMLNLLGVDDKNDFLDNYPLAMSRYPDIKFHSYAKAPRAGRKMGHLTLLGSDSEALLERGSGARALLYGSGA